jgi:hypothetical protein
MPKRDRSIFNHGVSMVILMASSMVSVAYAGDAPPVKKAPVNAGQVDQSLLKNCIARQGANSRIPMSQEQLAEECRKQIQGGHDALGNPLPEPARKAPAPRVIE